MAAHAVAVDGELLLGAGATRSAPIACCTERLKSGTRPACTPASTNAGLSSNRTWSLAIRPESRSGRWRRASPSLHPLSRITRHQIRRNDPSRWLLRFRQLEKRKHQTQTRLGDKGSVLFSILPATFLVAVVGNELVGRVSVRHELNDFLANFGGHIGYGVRPGYRRRGYAGEIFRQALIIARSEGIDRVLITCDANNAASATVIERNGGALQDVRDDPNGPPKRRYWID